MDSYKIGFWEIIFTKLHCLLFKSLSGRMIDHYIIILRLNVSDLFNRYEIYGVSFSYNKPVEGEEGSAFFARS